MKTMSIIPRAAGFLLCVTSCCVWSANFTANFNDGQIPVGAAVYGSALVDSVGGVGDSGTLKITSAQNSQTGSFVLGDQDAGAPVYGFVANMMVRVGGGTATPADGFSFCFAPDLPAAAFSEEGAGTGIIITFDTYDNGGGEAPAIDVKLGDVNAVVVSTKVPISDLLTGGEYVPVRIQLDPDGTLDLEYKGQLVYDNLLLPNVSAITLGSFGFGGRTGGLNANHWIDDLAIETFLVPMPAIYQQPMDQTVLVGASAIFSVGVNYAGEATYQWLRNGNPVAGATTATYTTAPLTAADAGAEFSVEVTLGGTSITSDIATVQVTTIDLPGTPVRSFDFDNLALPPGTSLDPNGMAYLDYIGVDNSGGLVLTLANNDESGWFIVDDPHAGAPVYGFAAAFNILIGGGTESPADGFSLNFATDLPPDNPGNIEEGVGSGVSICVDTYNNGGGEAPAFDLKVKGVTVATANVPVEFLLTHPDYVPVIVRLTPDGLLDLVWNGVVIFHRVPAEGFDSIAGGQFGFYARTGGLNANHWLDDIVLYTYLTTDVLRITQQPQSQLGLLDRPVEFSVGVNAPTATTYQWYRDDVAIAGQTQDTLTLASADLADDQARFKVETTAFGTTLVSDEAVLTVVDLAPPQAPQVNFTFDDGATPPNTQLYGTAVVQATGGVGDSGVLVLTLAQESQNGHFRIDPLEEGAEITSFTAAFDLRLGGGTAPPADGCSFNFADDLPAATFGDAENGAGTGLTVAFDVWDNGEGEAPAIDLKFGGTFFATHPVPLAILETGDAFVQVLIRLNQDGTVDVAFGDTVVYYLEPIPGYAPISAGRFGLAARTGGATANHWIDNLMIGAQKSTGPTRITRQPADALALVGQTAAFSVEVNDPLGVTYQWLRNAVAIVGATGNSYTTGPLTVADSGARFTVEATGNGSVLSSPASVTVMEPFGVDDPADFDFDFNNGFPPAEGILAGTAVIDYIGVGGSGGLVLTDALNDQSGSFVADFPSPNTEIMDFTLTFQALVGGGTEPPADGFSFVLGPDIPDGPFGEDGAGSGLIVSFDIYDNGGGEAPAIDVVFNSTVIASRKLPIDALRTGDVFKQVSVRFNRTGTLDLIYGDTAVFANLSLPLVEPFVASRFGFGARTGGLNDNHWIDDIRLGLNTQPPLRRLEYDLQDGTLSLSWEPGATLESGPTVVGPWSTVTGASSPYTVPVSADLEFFRLYQTP